MHNDHCQRICAACNQKQQKQSKITQRENALTNQKLAHKGRTNKDGITKELIVTKMLLCKQEQQ